MMLRPFLVPRKQTLPRFLSPSPQSRNLLVFAEWLLGFNPQVFIASCKTEEGKGENGTHQLSWCLSFDEQSQLQQFTFLVLKHVIRPFLDAREGASLSKEVGQKDN